MLDNIFNDYYFQNIFYCIFIIFISICVIKVMKKRNVNLKDRISFGDISWQFLVRIIFFSFFIRIIFEQILIYLNISQTDLLFEITFSSVIIFFIVRCIIAPITEEIIFRFGLYEFINTKVRSAFAIVLSSFIFAILHGYLIFDTILLTFLGVIWTYAYFKKKNLVYPIILHFLHNCYALVSYSNINNSYYVLFGILSFIIWVVLVIKQKRGNL
ncbi:MAG: lysostaphin resistance A-like protein [Bacilli bacterium]